MDIYICVFMHVFMLHCICIYTQLSRHIYIHVYRSIKCCGVLPTVIVLVLKSQLQETLLAITCRTAIAVVGLTVPSEPGTGSRRSRRREARWTGAT